MRYPTWRNRLGANNEIIKEIMVSTQAKEPLQKGIRSARDLPRSSIGPPRSQRWTDIDLNDVACDMSRFSSAKAWYWSLKSKTSSDQSCGKLRSLASDWAVLEPYGSLMKSRHIRCLRRLSRSHVGVEYWASHLTAWEDGWVKYCARVLLTWRSLGESVEVLIELAARDLLDSLFWNISRRKN